MSQLRRLRQFDCQVFGNGQQDWPPAFWQRTQASFGTLAGALSRSRWADSIGAENIRQQAVSGAMATLMEGRMLRGGWQPPEQSKVMFGGYATHWVTDRRLEPRSRELYAMLLRLHILPWFGDLTLDRIAPASVRSWRTDLLRLGRSESTAAKSYRLLRAILNTAVKDGRLLQENPCRMRGFDKEPTSERPTASVDQVWRLAALMPHRFRALVIFAAFPRPALG